MATACKPVLGLPSVGFAIGIGTSNGNPRGSSTVVRAAPPDRKKATVRNATLIRADNFIPILSGFHNERLGTCV